jgi:hypothetical protein
MIVGLMIVVPTFAARSYWLDVLMRHYELSQSSPRVSLAEAMASVDANRRPACTQTLESTLHGILYEAPQP